MDRRLPFGRTAALASLFLLRAAIAPASPPVPPATLQAPDGSCSDDRGTDRCAESEQARMRALYGVPPIEAHQRAGDQVRRVFYVDGYGRDLVLLAFLRSPGSDPVLRVHYPQRPDEPRPETVEVPVTPFTWNEVLSRSADFDRDLARGPEGREDLCLHSWVYTVEAVDRGSARVRKRTEDACGRGFGALYAWEIERIAVGLVPHCAALDHEQHRSAAAMLGACRLLHGDRLAAAEVLNRAHAFDALEGPADAARLQGLFADAAQLDWDGQAFQGDARSAAAFWAGRVDHEPGIVRFGYRRVQGEASDRVRLTGWLSRSVDTVQGSATGTETAEVEQIWVRAPDGRMVVATVEVGPWEPVRPR